MKVKKKTLDKGEYCTSPIDLVRNSNFTISERLWMVIFHSHNNGYFLTHKQISKSMGITEGQSKKIKKSLIKKGILNNTKGIIDDTGVSYKIPNSIPNDTVGIPNDTVKVSSVTPIVTKETKNIESNIETNNLVRENPNDFSPNSFSQSISPTGNVKTGINPEVSLGIPSIENIDDSIFYKHKMDKEFLIKEKNNFYQLVELHKMEGVNKKLSNNINNFISEILDINK